MFSGWILADKVLTWEQIHFKINFWKKKKMEKSLSTVRFWAVKPSWSGKMQYTQQSPSASPEG